MSKANDANNYDYVYGRKPVLEALKGRRQVKEIWLAGTGAPIVKEIIKASKRQNIIIKQATKYELDKLTPGAVHQGIVAKVTVFQFLDMPKLISRLNERKKSLVVILDGITDPRNLGSLMRSALCFDVDAIIIPKARSAPITPAVAKTSAGAVEHLNVAKANLAQAASLLKNNDFWLVGADVTAEEDVWDFKWPLKTALVLGSEGKGLSVLVKQKCDFLINIPISGRLDSLNVAVAGGILLNEYCRFTEAPV